LKRQQWRREESRGARKRRQSSWRTAQRLRGVVASARGRGQTRAR
jgi:hypothetical protein